MTEIVATVGKSLLVRLMAAFGAVILVGITITYLIANQATTNEFRAYMFRGGMTSSGQIARELAAYYASRGSWEGVDRYLAQAAGSGMGSMMRGRGMMGMMGGQLTVADASGAIVASGDGVGLGGRATSAQLADGAPIIVGDQVVGTLIESTPASAAFDGLQEEFLRRVNLSILLAGVVAGVIALGLGFLLFYQITAPLDAVAAASRRIASGDLAARVPHPRDDEIGQVGRAFNAMADSLARSEVARKSMIADIAHELRNPLGVIQGQLEGMLDGVFPVTTDQLSSIHEETLLLTRLVADLRDLALADAGQLKIDRVPTDFGALVDKTIAAFAARAAEKRIVVESENKGALPPVLVDPQRIEQVLRNLLENALRHTLEGGRVRIECSLIDVKRPELLVRVCDTGPGIPATDVPHVFERFWRGDKSRSRAGGGAGLGLAIARQLVAAHDGAIGVKSREEGGTEFWFSLPL